jgi:hypothetical protein
VSRRLSKGLLLASLLNAVLLGLLPIKTTALRKNQGLIITPLRQKVALAPGSTSADVATITNDTPEKLTVNLSSENFSVINENYDYAFKTSDSATWVRFVDTQLELQPHEKKQVSYSLAIPSSATPGAYDIALLATIESTTNSTSITEQRRVASLIYLDVGGNIEKKGSLLAFDIPWLTTKNDLAYQMRVANQGNSHLEFDVKLFSKLMAQDEHEQGTAKSFTLPRTIRSLTGTVRIGQVPGLYTVTATYSPPQHSAKQILTKRVLYVPWTFTASLGVLGLIIIFGLLERRQISHSKKQTDKTDKS